MTLRAVRVGEVAPPRSVSAAADSGSRRDLLVAMRARVALAVEDSGTPARDLAALTRRLMEIAKDIEQLDLKELGEGADVAVSADSEWEAI